jgi:fatty acid desaturase
MKPSDLRDGYLTPAHEALNVLHIVGSHAALAAWFAIAPGVMPTVLYVPLSMLASLAHQRCMSEWIHEGSHFNVVRNRKWNDRVISLLVAPLFGLSLLLYRTNHWRHHAMEEFFVESDLDTAEFRVGTRRQLAKELLFDICGINPVRTYLRVMFRRQDSAASAPPPDRAYLAITVLAQGAVLAVCVALRRLDAYVLYYVTFFVLYTMMSRLRVLGQHLWIDDDGVGRQERSPASRTIAGGFFDRTFVTSRKMMYHHQHHERPGLPWRALDATCEPCDDVNAYCASRWQVIKAFYKGLE